MEGNKQRERGMRKIARERGRKSQVTVRNETILLVSSGNEGSAGKVASKYSKTTQIQWDP